MNKAMDRFKLNATPSAHLQSISSGIKMLFSSFISRSRSSISLYVYNWFTSQNKWCISGDAACETCDRQFSTKTETHPIHCENSKREAEQYITRYHVGSCWSYYILLLYFFSCRRLCRIQLTQRDLDHASLKKQSQDAHHNPSVPFACVWRWMCAHRVTWAHRLCL